jgi:hypothetical protein
MHSGRKAAIQISCTSLDEAELRLWWQQPVHAVLLRMSGVTIGNGEIVGRDRSVQTAGGFWFPHLRRSESRLSTGVMVKF